MAVKKMSKILSSTNWHHTGVSVRDLSTALTFYRKSFGFEPVFEAMDMSDLIQSITGIPGLRADLVQCSSPISETVLELIQFRNIPPNYQGQAPVEPGQSHVAFLVSNLDQAIAEILAAGGKLVGQVTEFSEGRAAYLSDPAGYVVELEEAQPDGNT